MTKEENKKNEDDEYSILKEEAHKQDSLLKWMSFNKNPAQKSYNLDNIFKDDTFFFKRNENLSKDNEKESIIGKFNTVLSPKKPYLDDMSKLKDSNISLKRYLESTKDDTNLFNINNESRSGFKEEDKNNIKSSVIISDKDANKKDLLANISQIRGDLSKCTNLLKRKSELLNNSNIVNEVHPKHIKRSDDETRTIIKEHNLEPLNESKVRNLEQFHSSVIETKRKINVAIEEIKQKDIVLGNNCDIESGDVVPEIYLNKIEAHKKTEENYKKEINNLEREMKIRDIEISRLKSKLNYLNPQNNDVSLEKIINSGKESINILKEKLTQTENEVKQELEKVLKDNKKYENEIVGLKRIINKLTDKIKTLKKE